jgi:benzoyl-CoA reductase/2-hydroxyglutaryl-CoA dehydratase subunit BcrC/BadD/HgdB
MAHTTSELDSQLDYIRHSSSVIHAHSPGVGKLFDLALTYIFDAEAAALEGKKAAWTFGLWESPLFYACDTIPVSFSELGRLGSIQTLSVAEDVYQLPVETCSMIKSTIGEWHLRLDGPINRILGFSSVCEPYNIAWELMKKAGFEVHNIDIIYRAPTCEPERYEEMVQFFAEELRGTARWLSGHEADTERLRKELARRNTLMGKVRRIMELRIDHPLHVQSLPMTFLIAGLGHYMGKPEEYGEAVDLILQELELTPHDVPDTSVVPLVWSGGRGQEFGVYKAVDDAGGAILGWVLPSLYAVDYNLEIDPIEAMARYYLEGQAAGAAVYQRRAIEQQIAKVDAKGILMYGYLGCSFAGVDREIFREYFHKRGIPALSIEGSFQVGPPTGQLLTRVKAFLEMLS